MVKNVIYVSSNVAWSSNVVQVLEDLPCGNRAGFRVGAKVRGPRAQFFFAKIILEKKSNFFKKLGIGVQIF